MLYAFFGTDTTAIREQAYTLVHLYEAKGIVPERIDAESYTSGMLIEMSHGVSLFNTIRVVVIDMPSEEKQMFEEVFKTLETLAASKTVFVLIEGALLSGDKKRLAKYAEAVTELIETKKERFNTFLLADALLRRDKKSLWMLLQEARRNGHADEEILGTLFWQLKVLSLAARTESASEADQKPFVYEKAKRALQKFKEGDIDALSLRLVTLYHEGHSGTRDMDGALEEWVLSV